VYFELNRIYSPKKIHECIVATVGLYGDHGLFFPLENYFVEHAASGRFSPT